MSFQKFYENTIESKFIKNLLYNQNLPLLDTAIDGMYLIKNCSYLYEGTIIKCLKSGIFDTNGLNNPEYESLNTNTANCVSVKEYYNNESIPGDTNKYLSRYSYYDTETHRVLGNYLRWYRDTYKIDLMPFYNCWDYTFFQNIKLYKETSKNTGGYINLSTLNEVSKVIAVPIKLNKTYTICLDSNSEVMMKAVYYNKYNFVSGNVLRISDNYNEYIMSNESLTDVLPDNDLKVYQTTSFNKPIKFKIDLQNQNLIDFNRKVLYDFEKYLYLIIQVSAKNESAVVVLEGDYKNHTSEVIIGAEALRNTNLMNSKLITNLSLMAINDNKTYAFSNRLIEYLLLNVIDSQYLIPNSISKAQEIAGLKKSGVWNDKIRYEIFKKYVKSKTNRFDINGFVDKDIEQLYYQGKLR